MKPETLTQTLCSICVFILSFFLFAQAASPTNVLTVDLLGSRPPSSTLANVPVEKGKRPGLLFHFLCVDQITLQNPTNVCFPIQSTASTVVQIKIGNTTLPNCGTVPGLPGTCSYTFVDAFQNSNTCGPGANQPCVDTVKIVYNGDFPGFTTVQYSVSGVAGVSGEQENLANAVSFNTKNDTPSTVSLELVFDISGSMDWPAVPGGTTKRIDALKFSAQVLFGILNSYALPGDNTRLPPIPGDKLGAVFFSTTANPDATPASTPSCSGLPVTNLLGAADPNNVKVISDSVNAQQPTFSTSIGAGLQSADCGFVQETSPQNTNKQILLFSDGEQNTPPTVSISAPSTSFPNGQVLVDGVLYDPPNSIRICPVTAGRLAAPGFALQQAIAHAVCNDNNAHIRDADPLNPDPTLRDPQTFVLADLETFFAQSLTTFITSDKLEIVADTIGTVSHGKTTVEKFLGASNDVKMTIVLSSSGGSESERILPFVLKAPDGTVIDLTNRTTFAHNVSFTTLSFPLFQSGAVVGHKGEWQLGIFSPPDSPSVKYHLLVMADNPTIVSDFSINARDVGTGEPIPIRVKLTDNGAPVLNATVQVQMMGPSNSQGNVLSNTPAPPPTGPGPDPASTKGQAKLDSIYNNPANASLFADKSLPTLTLLDEAKTGVYTGSFSGTSNEGHYYFTVRVRGNSADAGDLQRAFWLVRFVRSKPDPANTVFKLLSYTPQANGSILVTLQAIPHDALGNFLGPGYEKDMRIKSSEGTVENALDDKLDGSYEITYRLPSAPSNPSFTIQIMGTTVTTKTLRDFRQGKLAVFLDAGAGIPHGAFGSAFDPGFSLNAGLEYILTSRFSAEGIFGYHHFPRRIAGDLNLYQFSANAKAYLTAGGTIRPFINGGIGGYKFSPGSTNFGGNFGGGLLYVLTPHWGLQGSYNFHAVNTPGAATKFSTLQGGIRFVF